MTCRQASHRVAWEELLVPVSAEAVQLTVAVGRLSTAQRSRRKASYIRSIIVGVLEMLGQLEAAAIKCAAAPVWPLSDSDVTDCLDIAHRLQQEAAAITLHLVKAADSRSIAQDQHHRTTASWLRSRLRLDPHAARTMVEQSVILDRHPALDHALSSGSVDLRQATVIGHALDDLPAEIDPDTTHQATTMLLGWAGELEAAKLRILGNRILDHVAPDIADRLDEAALAREEKRAHRNRGLTLTQPANGAVRITGTLTAEAAAIVRAALDPLCAPQPDDPRTPAQQRADALVEICRLALRTTELPDNGGEPPQVAVTVPYEVLTGQLGGAHTDTGERLTAETARRFACDARILPLVMGGHSQVLDAGRNRRLATGPQRRALAVRDGGCAFPTCDRPPRWCDAHHIIHWARGGATDLDNLVLLCGHHHRLIHEGHWTVRLGTDRRPEFIPPIDIDKSQRPRHNLFHPRT